jgi:hypothetical protein
MELNGEYWFRGLKTVLISLKGSCEATLAIAVVTSLILFNDKRLLFLLLLPILITLRLLTVVGLLY